MMTLQQVFGVSTPAEAKAAVEADRVPCDDPQNMEEWCLDKIGQKLYSIFIEGYTTKQWGAFSKGFAGVHYQASACSIHF